METTKPIINCQVVEMTRKDKNEMVVINMKNIKPYYVRPEWMSVDLPQVDPLFAEEITPELLYDDIQGPEQLSMVTSNIPVDNSTVPTQETPDKTCDVLITKNQVM